MHLTLLQFRTGPKSDELKHTGTHTIDDRAVHALALAVAELAFIPSVIGPVRNWA